MALKVLGTWLGDDPQFRVRFRADSVWTVIRDADDLTIFTSAVAAVRGLVDHLDSAVATTVLALSDDAFSALPRH